MNKQASTLLDRWNNDRDNLMAEFRGEPTQKYTVVLAPRRSPAHSTALLDVYAKAARMAEFYARGLA
jgi:hypothetical protein